MKISNVIIAASLGFGLVLMATPASADTSASVSPSASASCSNPQPGTVYCGPKPRPSYTIIPPHSLAIGSATSTVLISNVVPPSPPATTKHSVAPVVSESNYVAPELPNTGAMPKGALSLGLLLTALGIISLLASRVKIAS